jgi:hypothetical protein
MSSMLSSASARPFHAPAAMTRAGFVSLALLMEYGLVGTDAKLI